jgi:hypothetical protein
LPFEEAKRLVRELKIPSNKIFVKLKQQGKLPRGIPAAPDHVYRNKGWTNWPDILGNYYRALPFEKARNIVRGFKCKGMDDYSRLYKQGKLPRGMPYNPAEVYGNKGWRGYPDFLGYEYDQIQRGSALPYNEVKKILTPLKLSSQKEFLELHKQGKLPNGIPRSPKAVYRNKGWNSWPDFLGYEPKPEILSFKVARRIVRGLGCKSSMEYTTLYRQGRLPKGMPFNPQAVYSKENIQKREKARTNKQKRNTKEDLDKLQLV